MDRAGHGQLRHIAGNGMAAQAAPVWNCSLNFQAPEAAACSIVNFATEPPRGLQRTRQLRSEFLQQVRPKYEAEGAAESHRPNPDTRRDRQKDSAEPPAAMRRPRGPKRSEQKKTEVVEQVGNQRGGTGAGTRAKQFWTME